MRQAQNLFDKDAVKNVSYDPPELRGTVSFGSRLLRSSIQIHEDGTAENGCPCRDSREHGLICSHAIALALEMLRRADDPDRDRKLLEEQRKAVRQASSGGAYLQRAAPDDPDAVPIGLLIGLDAGWRTAPVGERIPLCCTVQLDGNAFPPEDLSPDRAYRLSKQHDTLLYVLEDICEGPVRSRFDASRADLINLLELCAGEAILDAETGSMMTVNAARLSSHLLADLDRETGELIVTVRTELPYMPAGEFPYYLLTRTSGWAFGAGNFWPLESVLPDPFHDVYDEPQVIPRTHVLSFMETELPLLVRTLPLESDLSIDLFTVAPARPGLLLHVKGSPAALRLTLYAEYPGVTLIALKPHPEASFSHPDPDDLLRFTVRNLEFEGAAVQRFASLGIVGAGGDTLEPVTGTREVLNFLSSTVPSLRRDGWRVEIEGRIATELEAMPHVTPVVTVDEGDGWFEVRFDFDDGAGGSLSSAEIQRALQKGDRFLKQGTQTLLLDEEAIRSMHGVFEDCASGEGKAPGSFRLSSIHGAYVQSALGALDGVDVEAPPTWQRENEFRNRKQADDAEPLSESMESILRSYQKEGVQWLRFLERNGFAGILADEMGLGKTVQTLAWLQYSRVNESIRGLPSLIVCPTSLVENWEEEAGRFVPELRVQTVSGSAREKLWADSPNQDLVITSYALLRRDIETVSQLDFAVAVLDEAQHIKNRSTQNSKAAKRLRAGHRLVLTGTPVENSVSDLWSIMDFLMPEYLGGHELFRAAYELPIGRGEREGEEAQSRLRRKLHPFLLRRLKSEVAKELPPKIQRVAKFALSADQAKVYRELLESSQRKLTHLVAKKGFGGARMEILTVLLRLRQICCHLDLLKLPDLKASEPSAKLALFLELVDEALDGGHRILVFSQFVSMLHILRDELEKRNLTYCYLDGSTKDRMDQVRRFNKERDIPLFLISLKAGGSGLNLTGADMVIHFDPWWNPAVEAQATDRAHRIGQQKTVYSVKLIARDTVEEKVLALQRKKQSVIDATIESDEAAMKSLDWGDIQELLSL
jgi:superfamily II DNA or RNA helicase